MILRVILLVKPVNNTKTFYTTMTMDRPPLSSISSHQATTGSPTTTRQAQENDASSRDAEENNRVSTLVQKQSLSPPEQDRLACLLSRLPSQHWKGVLDILHRHNHDDRYSSSSGILTSHPNVASTSTSTAASTTTQPRMARNNDFDLHALPMTVQCQIWEHVCTLPILIGVPRSKNKTVVAS